jgi:chromosomal replication initiator protein
MKSLWEEVKSHLKTELSKASFELWVNPISFVEQKENTLFLQCPNKFSHKWITDHYLPCIREKISFISGTDIEISLKAQPIQRKASYPSFIKHSKQLTFPNMKANGGRGRQSLNSNFTFDRFVVGNSNQFAYSASKDLAHGSSWNYHSLFMLANTGLGKSHLSQAIANAILEDRPEVRVFYITAEDFTNEMIYSLKNNRIESFKNKYRKSCDVLLLEEIHFLSGKEKTQVELAYTLDALTNDNRKIIFTSALSPNEIPKLSKQLTSRFASGLVTTISRPDYETRIKIISKKASELEMSLSQDLVELLAAKLHRDVRQIESALRSLKAKSTLLKAEINLDLAKEVLNCLVSEELCVSSDEIRDLVCKYYKIDPAMLASKSRKRAYTYPRNIYVYLCRRHTDETVEKIAKTINRTHSSVLYASELIERKIKLDDKVRRQVSFLSEKLENKKE